ncbi:Pkinase-domain-containing protein [Panus rudis PR-1116 ss-1]|nr:Pkinase-domain-containing protein [Panus rudis PR-1116 ss-1]
MSNNLAQASSPASPTASFQNQQAQGGLPTINLNGSNRSDGSAPGTPTSITMTVSLDCPPGMTFADFLRTWSDNHVARWLADIKCGHHAHLFKANDIRGDVLLELDQMTLKEMGLMSVGDRIRIISGVKNLRQKCLNHGALASITNQPRAEHTRNGSLARRLDSSRPAPLHLTPAAGSNDLPRIIRDGQDSARSLSQSNVRPLPAQPNSSHSNTPPSGRGTLPPLPPPPRGQPPQPPNRAPRNLTLPANPLSGRRTPTHTEAPPFTQQPLPPAPTPTHLTPTTQTQGSNWPSYQSSSGSRTPLRSPSPLPPTPNQSRGNANRSPSGNGSIHNRNASYSGASTNQGNTPSKLPPRPSTGNSTHPYAQLAQQGALSPINEAFPGQRASSTTPPPPSANTYRNATPFARAATPSAATPSLDDLRRKLIKFTLPVEGKSATLNVADCAGGAEVLEKALKKFGKMSARSSEDASMNVEIVNGGLSVEGWGAFLDWGQNDGSGSPLSESQILSICHAPPDEPAREHGLTLRQIGRKGSKVSPTTSHPGPSRLTGSTESLAEDLLSPGGSLDAARTPGSSSNATKRASTISVLSGLGVPVGDNQSNLLSPNVSPTKSPGKKPPSKLRNFFGQRPPSELITTHLAEYFPNAEKKVLERTRRVSMLRASGVPGKRDSVISWNPPPRSRFSVSTQASHLSSSTRNSIAASVSSNDRPPTPPAHDIEDEPPRVSISIEEGPPIEVTPEDVTETPTPSKRRSVTLQYLPPVAFPSESLAESMKLVDQQESQQQLATRRLSKRLSTTSSKRMSYLSELRSKRDKSDTASMMTVDEITAEVESRRRSVISRDRVDTDWTKVDVDRGDAESIMEVPEEEEEEEEEEESELASDVTVTDDEDDGQGKHYTSHGERVIKWIKGALIGAGSFGKVYLGIDTSSGVLMAVKQVELPTGSAPNEERKKSMLSALEREIELLKDLHHENIVQYLSSNFDDEYLNIFLEYVPGGSVTSLLRNYGAFEEPLVRNWVRQILTGLNYLHERDIIHRDIKGANMLVDNKGGIKISDFGISKKVEDNLMPGNRAHRPSLQGSVFWMAPEVVKQTAYTKKADIWSIGCLVVEMLTGEHPWAQLTQMQAIFKIGSSAKPTLPPDISPEAEDFLNRTFDLDHEARPSAADLLNHPWITGTPLNQSS